MEDSAYSRLKPYLASNAIVDWLSGDIPICPIPVFTKGMQANSYFFGHPEWGKEYLETSHRSEPFQERWENVMGSWDDKIVVDIGCGPGNVYATVGGKPKLLIGVDVSLSALKMAREIGYTPILTDAHHLPFVDGFADIVVANATVHHCDDMSRILSEAGRLVRPGGLLLTDQDPQRTAWNLKGVGLFIRDIRYPLYRLLGSKHYIPYEKRQARWKTEVHNRMSRSLSRNSRHSKGAEEQRRRGASSETCATFTIYLPFTHQILLGTSAPQRLSTSAILTVPTF